MQHLEHLSPILHDRCSAWSSSREVSGRLATMELFGRRLVSRGRSWNASVSFGVAGAALGAPQSHFAWQVKHLEHLQKGELKAGDT